ncbi:MAG: VCBS repeat-containing protein [Lentisphaerae bacterium]|nr:VCBS repeat-containing protein [Lentisphaerota bacterium]
MKIGRAMVGAVAGLSMLAAANAGQVPSLAGGGLHSLGVKQDGTLWSWGKNNYGQLGLGHNTDTNRPQSVALLNVSAVAGGYYFTLALQSDGNLYSFGRNDRGQLGTNLTVTVTNLPTPVAGISNVSAIAAGSDFALALRGDNTVWSWGRNDGGQLGNGSVLSTNSPVQVAGLTGISAIAAGYYHGLAVNNQGVVFAWGDNDYGQLGNPAVTLHMGLPSAVQGYSPIYTPIIYTTQATNVPGISGVARVAAGEFHSLALKSDGTVFAWGRNNVGQLGVGSAAVSANAPTALTGVSNVTAIVAGGNHSLALLNNGTVWAWGDNAQGQLGNTNVTAFTNLPVQVLDLSNIVAIAAGDTHSLAVRNDGTLWGWGNNTDGELGDGTLTVAGRPVQVALASNWTQTVTAPTAPSGTSNGYAGVVYDYAVSNSVSSWGRAVQYQFDWGNGSTSGWSSSSTASNAWNITGTYGLRARARSAVETDAISDWSATGLVTIARLAAPTGVSASDGTYTDKIRVTWNAATGASSYGVYRNTTNDAASAGLLSTTAATTLDDTTAYYGVDYYYWVVAGNSVSTSDWGGSDVGWRRSGARCDYDGDGRSDLAVYDETAGRWYILGMNAAVILWGERFGGDGLIPVPGDYDADGVGDLALYQSATGYWFIWSLDNRILGWGIPWGGAGMTPVAGDFDGDGLADLTVYQAASGYWFSKRVDGTLITSINQWGGPDFTPLAGDYNNDGVTDMAAYFEGTGAWFIKSMNGTALVWNESWGGEGLTPVPGDFDGDGNDDMAVYQESSGYWFIRSVSGTLILWAAPWGGEGMMPLSGDFDGDGADELAVYQPATGYWFARTVGGTIILWMANWGAPSMLPAAVY